MKRNWENAHGYLRREAYLDLQKKNIHVDMITSFGLLLLLFSSICSGEDGVRYLEFHYEAEVVARYGRTRITSVVRNDLNESRQLQFDLQLPDTAFISAFSM